MRMKAGVLKRQRGLEAFSKTTRFHLGKLAEWWRNEAQGVGVATVAPGAPSCEDDAVVRATPLDVAPSVGAGRLRCRRWGVEVLLVGLDLVVWDLGWVLINSIFRLYAPPLVWPFLMYLEGIVVLPMLMMMILDGAMSVVTGRELPWDRRTIRIPLRGEMFCFRG